MTTEPGGHLVLVVGSPRSGTHWMQRVVASHPDVASVPGETYLFSRAIAPLFEHFQHASPASPMLGQIHLERETLLAHARQLCDAALLPFLDSGIGHPQRVVERTPEHVHHMALVAELYPAARFVHIIRDGRRVVKSLLEQHWGPTTVTEAATEWASSVRAGRRQGAHVAHYVEVRNERLRAHPSDEIRRVFDLLDLPHDDEVIAAATAEAGVVANTRARRPRGPLTRRQERELRAVAGDVLESLGDLRPARRRRRHHRRRRGTEDAATTHWMRRSPHYTLMGVNRLLEVLRRARAAHEAADLLARDVSLRLVTDGRDQWWRGRDELADLLAALDAQHVLRSSTAWSAHYPSDDLHAVVLHPGEHGSDRDGTVLVRLGTDGVTEVAIFAFPLGGAPTGR